MEKESKEWLKEHCCYWYLLTWEESKRYFSQCFGECCRERKEDYYEDNSIEVMKAVEKLICRQENSMNMVFPIVNAIESN